MAVAGAWLLGVAGREGGTGTGDLGKLQLLVYCRGSCGLGQEEKEAPWE